MRARDITRVRTYVRTYCSCESDTGFRAGHISLDTSYFVATSRKEHEIYGLTVEEASSLQSEDEEFYGCLDDDGADQQLRDSSADTSEDEEFTDNGILDVTELESRVLRAGQHGNDTSTGEGLISPENDPVYSAINSKLLAGCSCSGNCLSQFTAAEVFSFHLSNF